MGDRALRAARAALAAAARRLGRALAPGSSAAARREVEARVAADTPAAFSTYPPLEQARARLVETRSLRLRLPLALGQLPRGCEGDLSVSEKEIVLAAPGVAARIALERVVEALLRGRGEGGTVLEVVFEQGGEPLLVRFEVGGSWVNAERLRKQIHLRAGRARPLAGRRE